MLYKCIIFNDFKEHSCQIQRKSNNTLGHDCVTNEHKVQKGQAKTGDAFLSYLLPFKPSLDESQGKVNTAGLEHISTGNCFFSRHIFITLQTRVKI